MHQESSNFSGLSKAESSNSGWKNLKRKLRLYAESRVHPQTEKSTSSVAVTAEPISQIPEPVQEQHHHKNIKRESHRHHERPEHESFEMIIARLLREKQPTTELKGKKTRYSSYEEENLWKGLEYSGELLGVSRAINEPSGTHFNTIQRTLMQKYFFFVFAISFVLYTFCAMITLICLLWRPIRNFFQEYYYIKYSFLATYIIISLLLSCIKKIRYCFPINYILLVSMSFFTGLFAGAVTAQYQIFSILAGILSAMMMMMTFSVISWLLPMTLPKNRFLITAPLIAAIAIFVCIWFCSYWFSITILQIISSGLLAVCYSLYLAIVVKVIMKPGSDVLETWDLISGIILIYSAKISILIHVSYVFGEFAKFF